MSRGYLFSEVPKVSPISIFHTDPMGGTTRSPHHRRQKKTCPGDGNYYEAMTDERG
jgi:hypothetical protein